jgi:uncharacterized damage-inducible protein DinB
MSTDREALGECLEQALSGRNAHALTADIFDGLEWELAGARPEGAPYSVFQLLNHLVYWQEFGLRWLEGEPPEVPEHAAESWPGETGPEGPEEWAGAIERFRTGLAAYERRAAEDELFARLGPKRALEVIQLVASHNSYHAGQVAVLRRMLGAWPPPGGGVTW